MSKMRLWALCKKLPIRIKSGGHNHEGFSTGNGIVIDKPEYKSTGAYAMQPLTPEAIRIINLTLKDYFGDNVERLQSIKQKYDPNNVFQFKQGIK